MLKTHAVHLTKFIHHVSEFHGELYIYIYYTAVCTDQTPMMFCDKQYSVYSGHIPDLFEMFYYSNIAHYFMYTVTLFSVKISTWVKV